MNLKKLTDEELMEEFTNIWGKIFKGEKKLIGRKDKIVEEIKGRLLRQQQKAGK